MHGTRVRRVKFRLRVNSVRPDDLAATIYHALGIDPQTELQTSDARPVHAADGKPISAIFA